MTSSARPSNAIWRLANDDAGTVFGGSASGRVLRTRLLSDTETTSVRLSSGWINGVSCGNNSLVAAGSSRGELALLDGNSFEVLASRNIDEWINTVQFVDSNVLVAGTAEGNVLRWDFVRDDLASFDRCHTDQIWDCRALREGGLVVTVGGGGEVVLWCVSDGRAIIGPIGHGYAVTSLAIIEGSRSVVTVDMGGMLSIRGLDTLVPAISIRAHEARIWGVAISRDERRLATVAADGRAIIWDSGTLEIMADYRLDYVPTTCDFAGVFTELIIGDRNGGIHVVRTRDDIAAAAVPSSGLTVFVMSPPPCSPGSLSRRVVEALSTSHVASTIIDVSTSPLRRESLRRRSGFPFFPQMYVNGRFIAGGDVLLEMARSGFLRRMIADGVA